ncbi:MAG: carboxylesterase family protein [Spirosomataceae bacterium]
MGAFGLGFGPTLDGNVLPYQFDDAPAVALYKDIPLLIGTVKNEFMASLGAGLSNGSAEKVTEFLKNRYKDKTEAYLAAVKKAYPNDTKPSDLMDVDLMFRRGAVSQAKAKAAISGGAPTYMYMFNWQSPVMDGKYKAIHCIEIPFVFNNIARCEEMTGGTKEAYLLADKVSQAWINFAKTGNPSHTGLPKWEPYTEAKGATMMFDNKCTVSNHHDEELLKVTVQ